MNSAFWHPRFVLSLKIYSELCVLAPQVVFMWIYSELCVLARLICVFTADIYSELCELAPQIRVFIVDL